MHKIKEKLDEDKERQLDEKVQEIEKAKDGAQMFKAVQDRSLRTNDEKGRKVTNPQQMHSIINDHFKA